MPEFWASRLALLCLLWATKCNTMTRGLLHKDDLCSRCHECSGENSPLQIHMVKQHNPKHGCEEHDRSDLHPKIAVHVFMGHSSYDADHALRAWQKRSPPKDRSTCVHGSQFIWRRSCLGRSMLTCAHLLTQEVTRLISLSLQSMPSACAEIFLRSLGRVKGTLLCTHSVLKLA